MKDEEHVDFDPDADADALGAANSCEVCAGLLPADGVAWSIVDRITWFLLGCSSWTILPSALGDESFRVDAVGDLPSGAIEPVDTCDIY